MEHFFQSLKMRIFKEKKALFGIISLKENASNLTKQELQTI